MLEPIKWKNVKTKSTIAILLILTQLEFNSEIHFRNSFLLMTAFFSSPNLIVFAGKASQCCAYHTSGTNAGV